VKRAFNWSRRRDERGAAAVEAALVTPILVLLVFGIIEFSFLLRDYVVVASDVRNGARIASTAADAGPGTCDTYDGAPPCTGASSPALAQLAADAMQRGGSAMPSDEIDYILVYQANTQGYPGSDGNTTMPSDCSGYADCVRFVWQPKANSGQGAFRYAGGAWDSSSISACFPGTKTNPLDRVGVYMHASHHMITGLFGTTIGLSDHTVMDFEPLPAQSCNGKGIGQGGHT
jgi:hypothetical protein